MVSRVFVVLSVAGAFAFGCDATGTRTTSGSEGGASSSSSEGAGGNGGTSNSSSGGGAITCTSDADCMGAPTGTVCDKDTSTCVGCLPGVTMCGPGEYCDDTTKQCANGCVDDQDCSGTSPICDPFTHKCSECAVDTDCPAGSICGSNICFPGCSPQQACPMGLSCCDSSCYDQTTDVNNCGACKNPCPNYANAEAACVNSTCQIGTCKPAFADCDKDPANGCEWNVLQDGACVCDPGATQPCYQGAPGTDGVGPCLGGVQMCETTGTAWGACMGQVLPKAEICGNMIDEDCNGIVDDSEDADGDGWPRCSGDCCDSLLQGCANPALVNPGAFEFVGNGVDDDCDAATSETMAAPPCSTVAKFTGVTSLDVAQSMGICQTTTTNPPLPQKKWGLLSALILFPDGTLPTFGQLVTILNRQLAILTDYGTGGIVPREGATMVGLSTGYMRDTGDPSWPGGEPDTNNNLMSSPPPSYLAAHMGVLPGSAGCNSACPSGTGANDATNIRYSMRVPTNAKSFSYQFKFISYEYWMYSCQLYNDYFLALLQTTAPGIPADKNISFDEFHNPVSVNNGFFDVCKPKGCYTCPGGYTELVGTGMENNNFGGGTKWLTTQAPVIPGETIQLEFMIFDVSDNWLDSVVLLDNFKWGASTAVVNTHD